MADITDIVAKFAEPLGKFLKRQFGIWLSVVSNPRDFVTGIDIRSKEAVLPALHFALFAYMASILIAMMGPVVYDEVDILDPRFLIADLVLTLISFGLIGLTLYVIGKCLGGSGGFRESVVAGLYLSAFWPILAIADYFLFPHLSILDEDQHAILWIAMPLILGAGLACFLAVKFYPVVAYVHKFGRFRAAAATVLQIVVGAALIQIFLGEYFNRLYAGS